jgi:hypothetical protein
MSAYANVSRMYGHKKVAQAKEIKTLQASQRALILVCLYVCTYIFIYENSLPINIHIYTSICIYIYIYIYI